MTKKSRVKKRKLKNVVAKNQAGGSSANALLLKPTGWCGLIRGGEICQKANAGSAAPPYPDCDRCLRGESQYGYF